MKQIIFVLALVFLSVTVQAQEVQLTWTINKVKKFELPDGSANYILYMDCQGPWQGSRGSKLTEQRMEYLLKYLNMKDVKDLEGYSFTGGTDPNVAFYHMALTAKTGNTNQSSLSDEEIYDIAARALAKMRVPDFSWISDEDVGRAFSISKWDGRDADPLWLSDFMKRVEVSSRGVVVLAQTDMSHFNYTIRGPCSYLELWNKQTGKKQYLTMGPYIPPIEFDSDTPSNTPTVFGNGAL